MKALSLLFNSHQIVNSMKKRKYLKEDAKAEKPATCQALELVPPISKVGLRKQTANLSSSGELLTLFRKGEAPTSMLSVSVVTREVTVGEDSLLAACPLAYLAL